MPIRIQRKRTKGYRMPENTKSVTRPGRFGNPYKIGDYCGWNIVRDGQPGLHDRLIEKNGTPHYQTKEDLVAGFKEKVMASEAFQRIIRRNLRGFNLACFCNLDEPCHTTILLEVANS